MPSGHYFDPLPQSDSDVRTIRLDLPDLSLSLRTDRGVFSPDSVDAGTKTLLLTDFTRDHSPALIADVGCGYGPIALTLAKRFPTAKVLGIEINERARTLCEVNAETNGLTNTEVLDPSDVDESLRFDEIWSNPPIRIGKRALHDLLDTWLGRLQPDGVARLVVHKHLGGDTLSAWMTQSGWDVTKVTSKQGYRILEVRHG